MIANCLEFIKANKKAMNVSEIERRSGIPTRLLHLALMGKQNLSESHYSKLAESLKMFGFVGVAVKSAPIAKPKEKKAAEIIEAEIKPVEKEKMSFDDIVIKKSKPKK